MTNCVDINVAVFFNVCLKRNQEYMDRVMLYIGKSAVVASICFAQRTRFMCGRVRLVL